MCVIIIHVFMHYALCKDINFIESPPSVELIGISELGPKKKKKEKSDLKNPAFLLFVSKDRTKYEEY